MSKIYYLWNTKDNKMMEQRLCSTHEQAERFMNGLTGYNLIPLSECCHCEIREKEVNYKCECDDYNQTTFVIIKNIDGEIKVVTTNNYFGIHDCFGFSIEFDIESHYKGYELMTLDYFHTNYKIVSK